MHYFSGSLLRLRRFVRLIAAAGLLCLAGGAGVFGAGTDHVTIREDQSCHVNVNANIMANLDALNAKISSPDAARNILNELSKLNDANKAIHPPGTVTAINCGGGTAAAVSPPNMDAKDFYALIHVFRWKDPSATDSANALTPGKQNWYVYHGGTAWRMEDFKDNSRIYGSKNVWLLFLHLNGRAGYPYEIRYDIDLKDVMPAPLQDGLALAQLFGTPPEGPLRAINPNFVGLYQIAVKHLPNDMSVQPESFAPPSKDADPVLTNLSDSAQKVSNEGRYFIDFGVSVPIRKISETTFDTTNNTTTPKVTGTTNAFGVIDIYPYATDIKTNQFSYIPYIVAGASISHQPLQKLLLAVGWGPQFAQFYIGTILAKQPNLPTGTGGTSTSTSFKPQFSFGINLSARGFSSLLKKN